MYKFKSTKKYLREYNKLTGKNKHLKLIFRTKLLQLASEPFYEGLKTHKVNNPEYGKVYSSRVTGDLRIIWQFDGKQIILLITVGGHSGSKKVYN